VGADLSFVLTAQEAALPIKCYGPELMVMPIYSIEKFQEIKNERERQDAVDKCIEKVALSLFFLFIFDALVGERDMILPLSLPLCLYIHITVGGTSASESALAGDRPWSWERSHSHHCCIRSCETLLKAQSTCSDRC